MSPAIWLTHTRADLYPEPFAFRPERFLDRAPTTYGWVPFGGGIRRCLGVAFAELEMRVVLSSVLARVRLEAGDAHGRKPSRGATSPSRRDMGRGWTGVDVERPAQPAALER